MAAGGADVAAGGGGVSGGCNAADDGALPSLGAILLVALVVARRRRALPLVALAIVCGCVGGGEVGWDGALADGPAASAAGQYLDLFAADRLDGHGVALALAGEEATAPAAAPMAELALSRRRLDGTRALRRVADAACGDRLVASDRAADGELVGYVATRPMSGTAALTELVAPDGCGAIYETDADAIALWVADGWAPGAIVGYVWPPGWGDAPVADDGVVATDAVKSCALGKNPALFLFYTGIDRASDFSLLGGCPGEVVLGEKHMDHPHGEFASATAHAGGGRTALVFGDNGRQFRDLLLRANGVERTAAFIRQRLEGRLRLCRRRRGRPPIPTGPTARRSTAASGSCSCASRRARSSRTSRSTSTMYPGGAEALRARRLLLRAFKLRARALALEEYLHTDAVMGGAAPPTFRGAADRIAAAVHGMKQIAGISAHEITTLGLSMHTAYPQYNYLDDTRHDLAAVAREATAIRHASSRTHAQRGVGFYFIGRSDITPSSRYQSPTWWPAFTRRCCASAKRRQTAAKGSPKPPQPKCARTAARISSSLACLSRRGIPSGRQSAAAEVCSTMGTAAQRGSPRAASRNSQPSMIGMTESSTTTLGGSASRRNSDSAIIPSVAVNTTQPAASKSARRRTRTACSSSTTSTTGGVSGCGVASLMPTRAPRCCRRRAAAAPGAPPGSRSTAA